MIKLYLEERDDERNRLRFLLDGCRNSRGSVAWVSGPPATGKSTLLDVFAEDAAASGAMVLRASGLPAGEEPAMGVVRRLLYGVPGLARGAEPVAPRGQDGHRREDRPAGALGARELWAGALTAAGERPLVVAVDDVQLIDEESAQALAFLARRIRSARVLLVLAETAPRRAPSSLHDQCLRLPYHRRLRLLPLSRAGTRRLAERRLGVPVPAAFAASCYEATGGNPLLLGALGDPRAPGEAAGPMERREVWEAGSAYREAVVSLVRRCGPGTPDIARGLAVLGPSATPALVAELLEIDGAEVRQSVGALEAAGALVSGRFRHPAALAAVRDDAPAAGLPRLHARAARLLHRAEAPARVVAERLADAGDADGPWARSVLREAARQLLAEDRADLAAEYLGLIADALRGDALRAEALLELADAEWRISPALTRRHLPELADALRTGRLGAGLGTRAARHLSWHGRPVETAERVRRPAGTDTGEAHAAARPAGVPGGRLALAPPPLSRRRPPPAGNGRDRAGRPGAPFPDGGPPEPGTEVLLKALTGTACEETAAHAEHILETLALDGRTLEPLCSALLALVCQERCDSAARWSARLLRQAAARPHTSGWQALFAAVSAEISLRRGALADAEAQARTAVDRITLEGWGGHAGAPLSTLITALTAMGRPAEAAELLRGPAPDAFLSSLFGPSYLYARGRHHAATGGFRAALGDFLACGARLTAWGVDAPGHLLWRAEAAGACLALGDLARARALVDEQLARNRLGMSRARGVTLRLLASVSDVRLRPAILDEAVGVLTHCGDRYELARALADLAAAQGAAGLRERARATARLAVSTARECRADPRLLRTVAPGDGGAGPALTAGPPKSGGEDGTVLSEAERRVASLAANGHTNREISTRLVITVSTVEQHLTRVYLKLGVTGRSQLTPSRLRAGRE
ncbi:AAA family ATPase [Streptomyces jumonjinensis]|uniref:AAA family ATPase n=3 Tax=Streptomyces jumonjinensis TaxID=1945 RepID=UPI00331E690B